MHETKFRKKSNFWDQVLQKGTCLGILVKVSMLHRGIYTSSNLNDQRKPKTVMVISIKILPCKLKLITSINHDESMLFLRKKQFILGCFRFSSTFHSLGYFRLFRKVWQPCISKK